MWVNCFHRCCLLNQVKINPVVKYEWEQRQYIGRLIAVHLNHTHVAYALRGMLLLSLQFYPILFYFRTTMNNHHFTAMIQVNLC